MQRSRTRFLNLYHSVLKCGRTNRLAKSSWLAKAKGCDLTNREQHVQRSGLDGVYCSVVYYKRCYNLMPSRVRCALSFCLSAIHNFSWSNRVSLATMACSGEGKDRRPDQTPGKGIQPFHSASTSMPAACCPSVSTISA